MRKSSRLVIKLGNAVVVEDDGACFKWNRVSVRENSPMYLHTDMITPSPPSLQRENITNSTPPSDAGWRTAGLIWAPVVELQGVLDGESVCI
mmetsp:Transcript_3101/g.8640  ORF Transcript_3101/g.8640 Transcript_3101/m.8640 type:complete len:92 (+) Transcript_3101:1543-1818(+)